MVNCQKHSLNLGEQHGAIAIGWEMPALRQYEGKEETIMVRALLLVLSALLVRSRACNVGSTSMA